MRKIIVSTYTTLDGYIDNPHHWVMGYHTEEFLQRAMDLATGSDALLLGRVTWEGMAAAWPSRAGDAFADHVNALPHYVVSSTLDKAEGWGRSIIIRPENLAEEVAALKRQPGKDIVIWGCGQLTDALVEHGLLDQFRLIVAPYVKGGGQPLWRPGREVKLELVATETFDTGLMILDYRPV